jgi:hypothetical protein
MVEVRCPEDVDDELRRWAGEAYERLADRSRNTN